MREEGPGYPVGPNVITSILVRGRWEGQSERKKCDDGSRNQSDERKGPQAKEYK